MTDPAAGKRLRALVEEGLQARFPKGAPPCVRARVNAELAAVGEGLMVQELSALHGAKRWCEERGIAAQLCVHGPSLMLAYLLNLSPFDPLEHGLWPEGLLGVPGTHTRSLGLQMRVDREQRDRVVDYLRRPYAAVPVHVNSEVGWIPHPDLIALDVASRTREERAEWDFRTRADGLRVAADQMDTLPLVSVIGEKRMTMAAKVLFERQVRHLDDLPVMEPHMAFHCEPGELARLLGWDGAVIANLEIRKWQDLVVARALASPAASHTHLPARYGEAADVRAMIDLPSEYASDVASIVADTRGLLIFQEQFTRIAHEVVGVEETSLRAFRQDMTIRPKRARAQFDACLAAKGHDPQSADELFAYLVESAPTLFSKAHALAESQVLRVLMMN